MGNRWWAAAVLAGGTAVLAACGSAAAPASSPASSSPSAASQPQAGSSSVMIRTASTKLGTVLTTAKGRTIYWFAIDTPARSNCTGSCATYWPPVLGKPVAAAGTALPHGFGTITRPGGQLQATYDGHPLYTYAGDTAAGQVSGNGLTVSGGLWWAMTPSGARPAAAAGSSSPSPSSSTGYGGY